MNGGYSYRERIQAGGVTVLAHFTRRHRHATEAEWLGRIEAGEVELDGRRPAPLELLVPGQDLVWHRPPWEEPEVDTQVPVLYEDEALLAVHKPSGLPTLPGGGFLEHTLLALVRARYPECSPMHRLGRGTSGLVLFARTQAAAAALQDAWRDHRIQKRYLALASGTPEADTLTITAPIGPIPHPWLGTLHAASAKGKASRSVAHVLERRPDATLLQVDIDTGRPHQIRIHLACAGHPLVGDPLYGPGGVPREGIIALPGDLGYFLHAERLVFAHPLTGEPMDLRTAPPVELRVTDA